MSFMTDMTDIDKLNAESDARLRADLGPRGFKTPPVYECEHGSKWAICDVCHPRVRTVGRFTLSTP